MYARSHGRTDAHNGRPRAKATNHKSDLQELELELELRLAPALALLPQVPAGDTTRQS